MSNLGIGVMLNMLMEDDNSSKIIKKAIGRKIVSVAIDNNSLTFELFPEMSFKLYDNGQSCCEYRYMNTDDDLSQFENSTLLDFEIRDIKEEESEYAEVLESQFLLVTTSIGVFTVVNYNEHNGYYGGFWLVAEEN